MESSWVWQQLQILSSVRRFIDFVQSFYGCTYMTVYWNVIRQNVHLEVIKTFLEAVQDECNITNVNLYKEV